MSKENEAISILAFALLYEIASPRQVGVRNDRSTLIRLKRSVSLNEVNFFRNFVDPLNLRIKKRN